MEVIYMKKLIQKIKNSNGFLTIEYVVLAGIVILLSIGIFVSIEQNTSDLSDAATNRINTVNEQG